MMLTLVVGLGCLLYIELSFLLSAFLGAIALYMLLRRSMFKMVFQWKMKRWLAALLLLVATLVVIVLPFVFVIDVLLSKLAPMLENTRLVTDVVHKITDYFQSHYSIDLLSKANTERIPGLVTQFGSRAIGSTLAAVSNLVVMYFLLWFMLVNGGNMERWLRHSLPLKSMNIMLLLKEIRSMVISNAIGIPVLGAIQGMMAVLGYYIFNVSEPLLWGIITGMASVIPFVGTLVVWVPIVMYKFATGDSSNAAWLLGWGLIVIGSSDNVIRLMLQKYISNVHPLVTVFGVIIGLNLFGFFGLIFGPLLLSMFLLLVRIYNDEFTEKPGDMAPALPDHPESV